MKWKITSRECRKSATSPVSKLDNSPWVLDISQSQASSIDVDVHNFISSSESHCMFLSLCLNLS